MQVSRLVQALQEDLLRLAAVGNEQAVAAAERLSVALDSTLRLRVLDVLSEAALELSSQLAGHVEVRLVAGDPELVFVPDEPAAASSPGDDALTARITLRLPEGLKATVELMAARDGLSANTWLVQAIARAVEGRPRGRRQNRLTGFAES